MQVLLERMVIQCENLRREQQEQLAVELQTQDHQRLKIEYEGQIKQIAQLKMENQNLLNAQEILKKDIQGLRTSLGESREAVEKAIKEKDTAQSSNVQRIKDLTSTVSFLEKDQETNRQVIIEKEEEIQLLHKK